MDARTFDRLTAVVAHPASRRRAIRLLTAGVLGGALSRHGATPVRAQDPPPLIDAVGLPPSYIDIVADPCAGQGLTNCGGYCADIAVDLNNCGGCGVVCGSGGGCFGGTCVAPPPSACAGRLTNCGGVCVNISDHAGHCGACFNSCPLGGYCHRSVCCGNGHCI